MVEHSDLDRLFAAVADPTRRAILARLEAGVETVTDLAGHFPMSLNAVSKHVKVLENAGLVRREVSGREHRLHLEADRLREAAEWIAGFRRFWTTRLDALDRVLRARKPN